MSQILMISSAAWNYVKYWLYENNNQYSVLMQEKTRHLTFCFVSKKIFDITLERNFENICYSTQMSSLLILWCFFFAKNVCLVKDFFGTKNTMYNLTYNRHFYKLCLVFSYNKSNLLLTQESGWFWLGPTVSCEMYFYTNYEMLLC